MKQTYLFAFLFFAQLLSAQNGLECIEVEKYYISEGNDTTVDNVGGKLPVGSVTYRIYVDMLPGYTFQAAYGTDVDPFGVVNPGDHQLRLETSTLFFNNEDRGATTPTFTKANCANNTVMLDSYLSVGGACVGNMGILKSKDNGVGNVNNKDGVLKGANPMAGIPLTQQDGMISGSPVMVTTVGINNEIAVFDNQNDGTNGPKFSTYNGSWACLGGCIGSDPTENKVLIAQITTNGIFSYDLNIQIGTPDGNVQQYVAHNPVGNEIYLDCLSDTLGKPNQAPTCSLTFPTAGMKFVIDSNITLKANAADPDGTINKVEFFIDNISIGTTSTSPYTKVWKAAGIGMHTVKVVAEDNSGATTSSSPVNIQVDKSSATQNLSSSFVQMDVFPNPADQVVKFDISTKEEVNGITVRLKDMYGRELGVKHIISQGKNFNDSFNLTTISSGMYFIEVENNHQIISKTFVKK